MLAFTNVRMNPNHPNPEYEAIINDEDRMSDEDKTWRVNTSLYIQNKHKLWKPWFFGTIICCGVMFAVEHFLTFNLVDFIIAFFMNSPIACVINGFQILANNKLRDMYNVNTNALRAQAKLESAMAFGAALSIMNTGRKSISYSMKPHDMDV